MDKLTSKRKARLIAEAALDRKARDVRIIDMRRVSNFTDFFVIAGGDSAPQLRAVTDEIEKTLRAQKVKSFHREGDPRGGWILIDCGDVVVHVFNSLLRTYYQIEDLWGDAPSETYPTPA